MKRIGIDARLFFQTGVGTYLQNLIRYIATCSNNELSFTLFVMEEDFSHISQLYPQLQVVKTTTRWHSVSEQVKFLSLLNKHSVDLMHFTYFSYPVLYQRPFIATVHDLTPLKFKTGKASTKSWLIYESKHFVFKRMLANQIEKAKAVITPTQAVANDIQVVFGTNANKLKVIYEGVDHGLKDAVSMPMQLELPYLLYIGNFYPHKNIPRLISAFRQVPEPYKLLLVGPDDFFASAINNLIQEYHLQNRVFFHHNVSKGELKYLYQQATAFVHPSLSEGFGLPIVEAMQFGLPIVCSDIPVFNELLQTNSYSFDPSNEDSLTQEMIKIITDKPKPDYTERLKRFDFSEMAKAHYQLYREMV